MKGKMQLLMVWGGILWHIEKIHAILPTATFQIQTKQSPEETYLAAPSSFVGWGGKIATNDLNRAKWYPVIRRKPGFLACNDSEFDGVQVRNQIVVVERGNCSFLTKAQVLAKFQPHAMLIRNTKQAIYLNDINAMPKNATKYPPYAYNCNNGQSYLPELNDKTRPWTTDDPICSRNDKCESNKCIYTGHYQATKGYQLCCMFDTFIALGANRTEAKKAHVDKLPVLMLSVNVGDILEHALDMNQSAHIRLANRSRPFMDRAGLIIWLLGVIVVCTGAYLAALPERMYRDEYSSVAITSPTHAKEDEAYEQEMQEDEGGSGDEELSPEQALMFIFFSGGFLVLLYYVHVTPVLAFFYAFASIGTTSYYLFGPVTQTCCPAALPAYLRSHRFGCLLKYFDCHTWSDIASSFCGLLLSIWWYTSRRTSPYAWIAQDIFGICLSFTFLRSLRLPNLKVATILLSLAFVYDVFFVFLSPLIFGSSVMIDVATGGKGPETHAGYPGIDYCERYPADSRCIEPEKLPMLLALPNFADYAGGMSLLGLGDIVLPGLLVTFALRIDCHPSQQGGNRRRSHLDMCNSYYIQSCFAYAVGLLMANLAVRIMQMGQPALFYLVPSCLGTMVVRAYRRNELGFLWKGPWTDHTSGEIAQNLVTENQEPIQV